MVKNPHILEALEQKEKKEGQPLSTKKDWYKKMDEMYSIAISLNSDLRNSRSEKHLEMLIEMRQKLNKCRHIKK